MTMPAFLEEIQKNAPLFFSCSEIQEPKSAPENEKWKKKERIAESETKILSHLSS